MAQNQLVLGIIVVMLLIVMYSMNEGTGGLTGVLNGISSKIKDVERWINRQ